MKKQSGFGTIETILIVATVIIISFTGWYLLRGYLKPQAPRAAQTVQYQPNMATSTTSTTGSQHPGALAATGHVAIPEWGTKISFADADKVTYKISTADAEGQSLLLYLKDSVAKVCQSLGVGFSRLSTKPDGNNVTKVGDYYYQLGGSPSTCYDDPGGPNGAINQLRKKIISDELAAGAYK